MSGNLKSVEIDVETHAPSMSSVSTRFDTDLESAVSAVDDRPRIISTWGIRESWSHFACTHFDTSRAFVGRTTIMACVLIAPLNNATDFSNLHS
jgi:hypothetical protein